jgi:hypothetical protein
MKCSAALLALLCISSPAVAECYTPEYVGTPGSRFVSLAVLPLSAALTVVTLPTGVIGVATRNQTLKDGTADTFCYTTGFAEHAVVGNRR